MLCAPTWSGKADEKSSSLSHPLFTASMRFLGLALFLVKQSERQCSVLTCERSAIAPEHASLRNICIMWIVSCCSGACVVDAVCDKVVCICSHVDLCIETTDVLPKSSKHLTGAKTLHESIQLCNSSAEGSTLDFSRLKEHQGTTGISPTFDSFISNEK